MAFQTARDILAGYECDVEGTFRELMRCLEDKDLPQLRWTRKFNVAQARLPTELREELDRIVRSFDNSVFDIIPDVVCMEFPAEELMQTMEQHLQLAPLPDRPGLKTTLEPLMSLAMDQKEGGYRRKVTKELLNAFLEVEEKFMITNYGTTQQDIIRGLRQEFKGDLKRVLDLVVSHRAVERKSLFVQCLLGHVVLAEPELYRDILRRLSATDLSHILRKAQVLLDDSLLAELKSAVGRFLSGHGFFPGERHPVGAFHVPLSQAPHSRAVSRQTANPKRQESAAGMCDAQLSEHIISTLVESSGAVEDALALLLALPEMTIHEEVELSMEQALAQGVEYRTIVTYIRRLYHHQIVGGPKLVRLKNSLVATWKYRDYQLEGSCKVGSIAILTSLQHLAQCLEAAHSIVSDRDTSGTLHVAIVGSAPDRFALSNPVEILRERMFQSGSVSEDLCSQDPRVAENIIDSEPEDVSRRIFSEIQALPDTLRFHTVSVMIQTAKLPLRRGFEWDPQRRQYDPQIALRHVEAPVARALELTKLRNLTLHHTTSRNRQWHIYTVDEKSNRGQMLKRLFLRGLVHQIDAGQLVNTVVQAAIATVNGCLEELLRVQHGLGDERSAVVDWAHIFLSILPPTALQSSADVFKTIRTAFAEWISAENSRLRQSRVAHIEIKFRVQHSDIHWRIILSLSTGHESSAEHVDIYREKLVDGSVIYDPQSSPHGAVSYQSVLQPYAPLTVLQQKRLTARRHGTTYCYDFPAVFSNALRDIWSRRKADGEPDSVPPSGTPLVSVQELGFKQGASLTGSPLTWPIAEITSPSKPVVIGMVAWRMSLKTPEAPEGREAVVVANDITNQSGSFGPKEDALFNAAVEYALAQRLPVIYLSANSGARVGIASDIRELIKVKWINEGDPSRGFDYLYLEDADYQLLSQKGVEGSDGPPMIAARRENGHWVLQDIIGCEDGLGVECLSGSGAIAGTFSKAFRQGFTITLVSSRSVGIGAYLARLGRRCVQSNQPIILTGYQALNKLLGREVYTSQLQLGGPRVMGVNGVSHHVVADDFSGIQTILKWLSFTPCTIGGTPNPLASRDPIDRAIEYYPQDSEKLDPRRAIEGWMCNGRWIAGLFDRGSWMESQKGWAQTVVTGRARLGGIAVGIISVETQTVFKTLPADPGMAESSEQQIPQAGQVWFPDSALKTAQAMEEFNLEALPLVILANWRGFSGGQRDLFEGVLQAGSLIVENLRTYTHPVFVYLPPKCELRGGAWVVIDSKISQNKIEMYADPTARGGVLEPEGVVEIKFKKPDLLKMMHRLDPLLKTMALEGAEKPEVAEREQQLLPVYHQVALQYAEMHDTPNRMKSKGVICGVVEWKGARRFLANRLKRWLLEEKLQKQITDADPSVPTAQASVMVYNWFMETVSEEIQSGRADSCSDDRTVHQWAASSPGKAKISHELTALAIRRATREIGATLESATGRTALLEVLKGLGRGEDPQLRDEIIETLEGGRKERGHC